MSVCRTADLPPDASDDDRRSAPKMQVTYGLCSRCASDEMAIRMLLAKEAKEAAEKSRSGSGRRRWFGEDAAE